MRILICDDEKQYCDAIRASVGRWAAKQSPLVIHVDTYSSSEDMLESLRHKVVYDIAFLDIQFPGEMNGLQVARELRALNEQMVIVFISNYEKYAVDGYKVNALRFFYKPVTDSQIFECLDIAYRQWRLLIDTYLLVESKQQMCRIPYRSILYIESRAHYISIHSANEEKGGISVRRRLADIMDDLPSEMFVQCHRSFVVNLLFVQKISRKQIVLTDGTEIPISPRNRDDVLMRFKYFYQGDSL